MLRFSAMAASLLAFAAFPPTCYPADKASVKERLISLHDRIKAIEQGKETVALTEADRGRIPTRLTPHDQMVFQYSVPVRSGWRSTYAAVDFADSKDGGGVRWHCSLADALWDCCCPQSTRRF